MSDAVLRFQVSVHALLNLPRLCFLQMENECPERSELAPWHCARWQVGD